MRVRFGLAFDEHLACKIECVSRLELDERVARWLVQKAADVIDDGCAALVDRCVQTADVVTRVVRLASGVLAVRYITFRAGAGDRLLPEPPPDAGAAEPTADADITDAAGDASRVTRRERADVVRRTSGSVQLRGKAATTCHKTEAYAATAKDL